MNTSHYAKKYIHFIVTLKSSFSLQKKCHSQTIMWSFNHKQDKWDHVEVPELTIVTNKMLQWLCEYWQVWGAGKWKINMYPEQNILLFISGKVFFENVWWNNYNVCIQLQITVDWQIPCYQCLYINIEKLTSLTLHMFSPF